MTRRYRVLSVPAFPPSEIGLHSPIGRLSVTGAAAPPDDPRHGWLEHRCRL